METGKAYVVVGTSPSEQSKAFDIELTQEAAEWALVRALLAVINQTMVGALAPGGTVSIIARRAPEGDNDSPASASYVLRNPEGLSFEVDGYHGGSHTYEYRVQPVDFTPKVELADPEVDVSIIKDA